VPAAAGETKLHVFGLTGGIASGKSTVAARLRARGVPVVDADLVARDVVAAGTPGLRLIVEAFGSSVLDAEGALDRKALASVVFHDDAKRKQLNTLLHPLISARSIELAAAHGARGEPLVCYEAALLVENGVADMFRPLVLVAAPEELQLARVVSRDAASRDDALARIRAQKPLAEKISLADFVIETTGTLLENARRTDDVLDAVCARVGVDASRYPRPTP
jgi:dephospho-CoA kinase